MREASNFAECGSFIGTCILRSPLSRLTEDNPIFSVRLAVALFCLINGVCCSRTQSDTHSTSSQSTGRMMGKDSPLDDSSITDPNAEEANPGEFAPVLSLDGGTTLVETLVAGAFEPTLITLSNDSIWWTDSQSDNLWRTTIGSNESKTVIHAHGIVAIAATLDRIGWVAADGVFVSDVSGSRRVRIHGELDSSVGAAIFSQNQFYFSDGVSVWMSSGGRSLATRRMNAWGDIGVVSDPQRSFFAKNQSGLFWSAQGMVLRCSDGSAFQVFFPTSMAEIVTMTSSDKAVIFADKRDEITVLDAVARRKVRTIVRRDVVAMAVRDNEIYWARSYDDLVLIEKTPLLGGEIRPVLRFHGTIGQMVADRERVIWTMPSSGRLVQLR